MLLPHTKLAPPAPLPHLPITAQAKRLLRASILKIEQSDTLLDDDLGVPPTDLPAGVARQPEDAPEARIERGEDVNADENDENAPPGANVGEKRGWVWGLR